MATPAHSEYKALRAKHEARLARLSAPPPSKPPRWRERPARERPIDVVVIDAPVRLRTRFVETRRRVLLAGEAFQAWAHARVAPVPAIALSSLDAEAVHIEADEPHAPEPVCEPLPAEQSLGVLYVVEDPRAETRIGFAPSTTRTTDDDGREFLLWEEVLTSSSASVPDGAPALTVTGEDPIAEDVRTLESMMGQQEWKAAGLVGGAAMEALLSEIVGRRAVDAQRFADSRLARPKQDDGVPWHKSVSKWGLYGLIWAARELAILTTEETALCHRARIARNAIHGREAIGRAGAQEVHAAVYLLRSRLGKGGR